MNDQKTKLVNQTKGNPMTLHDRMHRWLLRDVLATPRGRAFMLWQAPGAESRGERRVLDVALEAARSDPDLAGVLQRHRADAARHAALFAACAERQGAQLPGAPRLEIVDRIDRRLGAARLFVATGGNRVSGYLFLQVLAERASTELAALATALRPFDPRSAGIVVEVATAERRHLRERQAAFAKIAESPDALEALAERFRRAEAAAHEEHARALVERLVAEGLLGSGAKGLFWRGVGTASALTRARAA